MWVKHYLSQTYLKGFSTHDDSKKIHCYDKELGVFITSYKITQKQTMEGKSTKPKSWLIRWLWCKHNQFWTSAIEEEMMKIENDFPKILDLLMTKSNISVRCYDILVQLIVLQVIRYLVSCKSFHNKVNQDKSQLVWICNQIDFPEWIVFLNEEYSEMNNRELHLINFIDWIKEKTSPVYTNLRNRILKVHTIEEGSFSTWDFPFYHLENVNNLDYPSIFFPVSEKIMIVFQEKIDGWEISFEPANWLYTKQAIFDRNKKMFTLAERYIFCSSPEIIKDFIV